MLIDDYFDQLENIINSCGYIQTKIVHKDKRSDYVGYFRADLYFHDDSLLHVREFVSTRVGLVKGTYTYHYQDSSNRIIFRYDNTEHFPVQYVIAMFISSEENGAGELLLWLAMKPQELSKRSVKMSQ